ncbi:triose-phosphate isomerase [Pseudoclavibacter sp. CFCC 13611]|uniref:triose-phosphate isomerase n=1 Tax=Pseudoclavibacter sp. CFCC 13611 TaxID=2615178 RepID=UPI001300EC72|nr:triose-phosphate isomerase [Pseudoclavibacter sp. CFCC 13611]KAB1663475.1 triose-phosphate isomerase [Pseudoclavibacter sp. CFCC 13611]
MSLRNSKRTEDRSAGAHPVGERTPLIAGNWKMNIDHLHAIALVQKVAWTLRDADHDFDDVEVAVFPPFTDLRSVQSLVAADKLPITFGAQDVSEHDHGAFTGDISGAFLNRLDAKYAIVGHSERRLYHHEDDAQVGRKALAAIRHGLVPLICVGETAADLEAKGPAAVPVQQLQGAVAEFAAELAKRADAGETAEIVIAYEPVWAIGSGKAATAQQAQEVIGRLRGALGEALCAPLGAERADAVAAATRILYGGSVAVDNVAGFLAQPDIDGALVGGASLDAASFAGIAQFRRHVRTA